MPRLLTSDVLGQEAGYFSNLLVGQAWNWRLLSDPRNPLPGGELSLRGDATIEEAAGGEEFGVEKGGAGGAAN